MPRVLAALSGGVDSSVAALLLQEAGYEVVGVFMRNGVSGKAGATEKSCCSASDSRDAALVASRLGIPFYAVDFSREFAGLIDHFAAEYRRGRTPNPCVLCNTHLKFGQLFELADAVGAELVATGHYADVRDGRLLRAADAAKDQTYYLFGVARPVLARVRFPLGRMHKAEVRERARAAGLATAEKPESMEICFVTSGEYRDVVRARGGGGASGVFVDEAGRVLGRHDGVDGFTVGQRSRLPALGTPRYVQRIDAVTGTVVLAPREALGSRTATLIGVNWLVDPPGPEGVRCEVKIRARSAPLPALVVPEASGGARITFAEPASAAAPGQAAVFYRGDLVLGGGWLEDPTPA